MTRTCRDIVISCVAIGVLSPSDLDRPWRIRRLYPSRSDRGCGAWSWCLVCDDRGEMSSGFIGSCRPAAEVALSKRIDLDLNHGQFTLDPLP